MYGLSRSSGSVQNVALLELEFGERAVLESGDFRLSGCGLRKFFSVSTNTKAGFRDRYLRSDAARRTNKTTVAVK